MNHRTNLLKQVQARYIPARLQLIDKDLLKLEEDLTTETDLEKILSINKSKLSNPYNSTLLYLVGITDDLIPAQRVTMVGGSAPD